MPEDELRAVTERRLSCATGWLAADTSQGGSVNDGTDSIREMIATLPEDEPARNYYRDLFRDRAAGRSLYRFWGGYAPYARHPRQCATSFVCLSK
jgi:hypothetical protein